MVIAYLRISTGKQHIANQQDEIMRFALSKDLEIHNGLPKWSAERKRRKSANWARLYAASNRVTSLLLPYCSD